MQQVNARPMQCVSTQSWKQQTREIILFLFIPHRKPAKLCYVHVFRYPVPVSSGPILKIVNPVHP